MKREFFINIIFLIAINLLIKPFYIFGIDRTVQNRLEPGIYGIYFTLFSFTFLFQIINDFGIQNYNNRHISQHSHLFDKYFPNIVVLKGLLGLLFLFLLMLVGGLLFEPAYYHLLLIIGINQFLLSFVLYLRSNVSGLALYRTDSFLSVLDKLLLITICSVLLWAPLFRNDFKIEWFVYAQTFSLGTTAVVTFWILKKHLLKFRFRINLPFLLVILKKSYPYALIIFLMTAYTRIDGVMIDRMLEQGELEADIYASAYRLLDAANIFGFLFAGLLLPMFSRMIKNKLAVNDLVRSSTKFILAGSISLVVAVVFFREEIMVLLYTDGNAYSGDILGFLIASFIAMSTTYIYGSLLTANGNLMQMNAIFLTGVVINVILNLFLIPREAALGAAIATCVTQFLMAAGLILLSKRVIPLKFAPGLISRIVGFALVTGILSYAIHDFLTFSWFVKFLLCILAGAGSAFVFQLFPTFVEISKWQQNN